MIGTYFQAIELLRDCSHVRNRSRAEWEDAIGRAGLRSGTVVPFRVRLDFRSWVERMHTPKLHANAILALQRVIPDAARTYFNTDAAGSFSIDVALFQESKPG